MYVMDWADGHTKFEGIHKAGCKDIRDADPINSIEELRNLIIEEDRKVFPCASSARKEV